MAGYKVSWRHFNQLWSAPRPPAFLTLLTSGEEATDIRKVYRGCNFTCNKLSFLLFLSHHRQWNCRKHCLCIWVDRIIEELIGGGLLHHLSQVHYGNLI